MTFPDPAEEEQFERKRIESIWDHVGLCVGVLGQAMY